MRKCTAAILLVVFCCSQRAESQDKSAIAKAFVEAINSHDIDAISRLMSDEHAFIDAHGNRVLGREKMRTAWNVYFSWFPDYKIGVETLMEKGDTVAIIGSAEGTYHSIPSSDNRNHWKLPAAWRAIVSAGKVSEWHVFSDTKVPFDIMQRHVEKSDESTERVTGIGGVFFKSKNPKFLVQWYDEHLGTGFGDVQHYSFTWSERGRPDAIRRTVLGVFGEKAQYFQPSEKPFMLNFRVKNLDSLLSKLKSEGVRVDEKVESYEYGKFGWILDPEGNKIELWEPVDEHLEK